MERTTFCCTRHSSVHSIHKGTRARRHVWHSQNGIRAAGSDKSTDRKFRTVGTVLQKSQRRCTRACAGIKEVITDLRIPVTVSFEHLSSCDCCEQQKDFVRISRQWNALRVFNESLLQHVWELF